MKKLSLLHCALFSSIILTQSVSALTEAYAHRESEKIAKALFSYDYQTPAAQFKINNFVNILKNNVFHHGRNFAFLQEKDLILETFAAAIRWIGTESLVDTQRMVTYEYYDCFTHAADPEFEKTAVISFATERLKARTNALLSRCRSIIASKDYPTTNDILYECKGALRTYIGKDVCRNIKMEIDNALKGTCEFYCGNTERTFFVTLPCGHHMHRGCYTQWRNARFEDSYDVTCPNCGKVAEAYVPTIPVAQSFILTGVDLTLNDMFLKITINWRL